MEYYSPRKWEKENEKTNGRKKRKPRRNKKKFDSQVKRVMEKRGIGKEMATKVVEGWWEGNRYNGPEPRLPKKIRKQKENQDLIRRQNAEKKRQKFIEKRGY